MSLNLITDPWIPVLDRTGARRVIAPWQMADATLLRPDWPRPDLNIACLELLIGLVYLADPPADAEDWEDRQTPDPDRLRARLAPLAPAFNLLGEGPLFLQDLERLEGEANPPDMLFIDSAGANTARNNADLMVHRERYPALEAGLAAMALYAFQAHAPSGGAGNRTSMRGGGPLVTLVDPGQGLWPLIWANVPDGTPQAVACLPWMAPTRLSDKGAQVPPPQGATFGPEAFFGMPRRLRLIAAGDLVTGVVQKPWGTNYAGWMHPLSPHYRLKAGEEWLPVHPRAGRFGYRHWLGILAEAPDTALRERAACLRAYGGRVRDPGGATVLLAGWAMDNMKPRDFTLSVQPFVALPGEAAGMLAGLVEAAEQAALALRAALEPVLAGGEAREAQREAFYAETEPAFGAALAALRAGEAPAGVAARWLAELQRAALARFDALALPGLDRRETDTIRAIVEVRGFLAMAFRGYGKYGGTMFGKLQMPLPAKKKGRAA
ncbi:CRISPR system Cascade subunit CasA [Gemmobacter caeni]|uniref:CRISPR system Cascade subunit CasA n=1 Tax=Gemmobacter caeni TaxID=589035 RepID=A0A2T6A9D1_9RHOB|nr:type I-E CRISPR-associated protein Cse1/CasA [Gemmobacter caeni]PTX40392.1 CRISPR system Cascade subunit CasA [Gemmobacter caeni]TWI89907.1 CRISPR system Cascade subunit CasA [Gemmobacter caeni]